MPKRIQRKRLKGWRLPPNTVCVTRPGIFGNPWVAEHPSEPAQAAAVQNYEAWIDGKRPNVEPARRKRLLARLPELAGKDLACFCREDAKWCHGDVLLRKVAALGRTP